MSLSIGIIGLPNVGKSTLFNALVKGNQAEASNYPFCTIKPNVGVVEVPDQRLEKIAKIAKSAKIIPAVIEFVDIAGLVAGAHKGEGLGNKFLSHIREVDAIAIVTRFFSDDNITHVNGTVSPKDDIETIMLELIMADLQTANKSYQAAEKQARDGKKENVSKKEALKIILDGLEKGIPANEIKISDELKKCVPPLLTEKPRMFIANIAEQDIKVSINELAKRFAIQDLSSLIAISAKLESELANLDNQERADFLTSYGLEKSGLEKLISSAYDILGLQSYFTAGLKEARAWTIHKGANARQAASVIHTDFAKGFIRAEVIAYEDYIKLNGEDGAKDVGKMRSEGKEYTVRDGDVIYFKFNV